MVQRRLRSEPCPSRGDGNRNLLETLVMGEIQHNRMIDREKVGSGITTSRSSSEFPVHPEPFDSPFTLSLSKGERFTQGRHVEGQTAN